MSYWTDRIQKHIDGKLGRAVWTRFFASLKDKQGGIWVCGRVEPNTRTAVYGVAGEILDKYPPVKVAYLNDIIIEHDDITLQKMRLEEDEMRKLEKLSADVEAYVLKLIPQKPRWRKSKFRVESIKGDTMSLKGSFSGFLLGDSDSLDLGCYIMRRFPEIRTTVINSVIAIPADIKARINK